MRRRDTLYVDTNISEEHTVSYLQGWRLTSGLMMEKACFSKKRRYLITILHVVTLQNNKILTFVLCVCSVRQN
jgi:hypothetical protein